MKNQEKNIVDRALARFEEETGLRLIPFFTDEKIDVVLREKDYDLKFNGEVKLLIDKAKLGLLKNQLNRFDNIQLLITWYANPENIGLLKNLKINFIDAAGNAYINVPPLYINIKGNKLDRPKNTKGITPGKFQTAGLQIIFTLLCNPNLEKNTYREIAQMANVALGTVVFTFKYLENLGYLTILKNDDKKLINKNLLLKEWLTGYPVKIKQKYLLDRYQADDLDLIGKINIQNFHALFGGETAAAKMTNYLRPFFHTIYIGDKLGEFILKNRLKKNPNGNIILMKKFWNFDDDYTKDNLVPAILIYTDLMITADPRNIETANIIYEREIAGYLK